MALKLCLVLAFWAALSSSSIAGAIGVNWGTSASHPLPPPTVVELLKSNNIGKVKLFDADPTVLSSLSGSNIDVTVGIPNSMVRSLSSSKKVAEDWVHNNLTQFLTNDDRIVRIHSDVLPIICPTNTADKILLVGLTFLSKGITQRK